MDVSVDLASVMRRVRKRCQQNLSHSRRGSIRVMEALWKIGIRESFKCDSPPASSLFQVCRNVRPRRQDFACDPLERLFPEIACYAVKRILDQPADMADKLAAGIDSYKAFALERLPVELLFGDDVENL